MLLQELNKQEAVWFTVLVAEFANVDQNFAAEEKEILERYLKKFNISKEEVKEVSLEEAEKGLEQSSQRVKKLIYFELVGIALIDGDYETSEINFLEDLAQRFGITRAEKMTFANYYFDFDKIKELSEEEKENKVKDIIK